MATHRLKYPEVSVDPEPIWNKKLDVPLREVPLNRTVIFFTQEGMLVNEMDVPEVDATCVPCVIVLPLYPEPIVLLVRVCESVVPTTVPAGFPVPPAGKVMPDVPEITVVI